MIGKAAGLVISPQHGQPRPLSEESGPIVGIMDGFSYDTYTGRLAPGETLVLYTDGVTEARDKNDAFFGDRRLEQLLAVHCGESAEQLVASLHAAVQEFAIGEPQADDITVLALRYGVTEPVRVADARGSEKMPNV